MRKALALLFLALATFASPGAHAASGGPLPIGDPAGLAREGRWIELKALEDQQRMLRYQRDHQDFMESLRRAPPAEQLRPEVPRMQRNCQGQVYGSSFLPGCR